MSRETPLSRQLRDVASEEDLRDAWKAVERRRAHAPRRGWWWVPAAALVLLMLLAVGIRWADGVQPATLSRVDGAPFDGVTSPVALEDGSTITPSDDGVLRVLENQAGVLALHLERGAARFAVTPGTGRRWRVEADGVVVEVVGTVFTVDRRAGVSVAVERGAVVVRGDGVPDGVHLLRAGESLRVSRPTTAAAVSEAPPAAIEPPLLPEAPSPPSAASPPAPTAPRRSTAPTVAALLATADQARAAGRDDEAVPILDRIAREHREAPEAGIAAFTAARIVARRGDGEGAAERYRDALALGLPPELEEAAERALAEHPVPP